MFNSHFYLLFMENCLQYVFCCLILNLKNITLFEISALFEIFFDKLYYYNLNFNYFTQNPYEHFKEVRGAQGVKLLAKDLDKALAGLPLFVAQQEDEIEHYKVIFFSNFIKFFLKFFCWKFFYFFSKNWRKFWKIHCIR